MFFDPSGGGSREEIFWRNYFFHCAFTRYEAGLSIDEIWSFQPESAQSAEAVEEVTEGDGEDVVIFDNSEENEELLEPAFQPDEPETDTAAKSTPDNLTPPDSVSADYEFLDEGGDISVADPELDELEAEILRELEN